MRAVRLAYDGTGYRGFQRQPHGDTVENALFEALEALDVAFEAGAPVGYAAAGRTDAGVSARAQTVAFASPEWLRLRALNAERPADVRAWAAADADADVHATHDAAVRRYCYYLYAPDASDDRAAEACRGLSGRHDLHNFTPGPSVI
jgi:tRNA pseudouridine38-40 synthase